MATQVTVITGEGSTSYSVSTGARGPTGAAGPEGTITNSSVNTAIATNPSATRTAAGLVIGTDVAAQGDTRIEPQVKSSSFTASNGETYHVVAPATVTDPSPVEGKGFSVLVRNGTATIGGTPYSTAGTIIVRTFHSGGWSNYSYQVASTFAATAHTHASSDISDSTAAGRTLLTAANAAAQIAALGAETPAGASTKIKTSAEKNLRGLKNAINTAYASGVFPISIIQVGDSFSDFAQFDRSASIVGSWRCGAATAGGDSGVTTVTSDFANSPDGIYKSVASGGNLTCAHLLSGTQGKATHVYYTFLPGTGTAQLQWSNNGGAWTNVGSAINTASIAANSVQVGSIALGSQQNLVRCRVTATGGTVNGWIGQGCDGPGLTVTQFGGTGQGVEQTGSIAENVWKNMVTGYKPSGGAQIIFVTYADIRFTVISGTSWPVGTEGWGAAGPMQQLYTWSKTADSNCDWFVVGPHQVNPSLTDTANATVDALYTALGISNSTNDRVIDGSAAQREFAERNAEGFISCIDLFPTWSFASAYYEDDIHIGPLGEAYKRSYVWRNSNIGWILGDVGYSSQVRIGDVALRSTKLRSGAAALIGESLIGNGVLAPITMSQFRAGLPGQSEQAGVLMYCFSANVMRLANFGSSGISSPEYLELSSSGSTAIVRPVTTTAPGAASLSQLGASANRWGDIWTNGIVTGLVRVSANYTVTVTDHFVEVTANSPTVTLLNAAQNLGREYIIQNTGAGIVTMATTSSQTIGGLAPGTILAGATLKVKSNGINWLIIP